MSGLTNISENACVNSCTGLNSSVIGVESCGVDGTYSCCNHLEYYVTAPNGADLKSKHPICFLLPKRKKTQARFHHRTAFSSIEIQAIFAGVNVAKDGYSTQSSTWGLFNAENAINNNASTFSHTNDGSVWLMVDLGAFFDVESVMIENRFCRGANDPSGCLCHLTNATMSLLDGNDATVSSVTLGNTCRQRLLETLFVSSPSFCANQAMHTTIPSIQPNEAPLKWMQRSRRLRSRPKKC
ncbi:hypothetical protein ACHAWO_005450 [Cyclotella atomus]|uniref:F5/8 type C domain-containing protein n=1 Tax=Cyclotella atomus TaxID=382360 RepID=A0ABD3R3S5_9STRA